MLFVGIDVHKETHTVVGITPFGEKVLELTIKNTNEDFNGLVEKVDIKAKKMNLAPCFGLEDVHSYGERLSSFLVERSLPVRAVPPILVDHCRLKKTHPEKSDSLDAQGVAEVMIQKIDKLPVYTLTEKEKKTKQIRELSLERETLVKERVRIKNQLHVLLYRIHNNGYEAKFKDPFSLKATRFFLRSMPRNIDTILKRRTKRALRRLLDLRKEIKETEEEIAMLLDENNYTLSTASGCGTVIAAEIIGEIKNINRFHSPGALAKYAGCAPREHSSGKTVRWRKTRSGNRRLNRAFHRMALSQISRSGNKMAKEYFQRKISEGKTKTQALVCLRRQLVNVVWMMMKHNTQYRLPC